MRIVLYRLSTSNHNISAKRSEAESLSYIVFLHQTTTLGFWSRICNRLSYIVFLHQTTTLCSRGSSAISLSYIVFLHQTTTCGCARHVKGYCLISSFYIKPQLAKSTIMNFEHCLISSFYIKPQLLLLVGIDNLNCLISSFYIKPQPAHGLRRLRQIVLYRLSTSNHNQGQRTTNRARIVLYRLSTSNHNLILTLNGKE